ncbi:TetR/AcrR family transcriptional regulator [Actinomadura sp. HBU206391]|uniref:TetR/AcrR family transcriptional regulator n=1 Tax=Actinomadura sp. HBU206391 TaxID=2731692 RepID=UPI00165003C0|nr:TetR/AcrR family transcriptional regulator [Actinomadura sp. HBU206391]MBC6460824.1 TetR/AcrR family transcriptional regulator [Actinomadura sp. HBU206391]
MPRRRTATAGETSTPDRIRATAIRLFAERGFHGTGIRDIATAADTTLSSLYHHFGSKDDLLVDIMIAGMAPLMTAGEQIRAAYEGSAERLAMLVEQHVWAHGSDRLTTLVGDTEVRALTGERRERILAMRDGYEALWRGTVEEGAAQGVFDVEQPKITTLALLEMCTGVSHWYRPTGDVPLATLCGLYADSALAVVRATGHHGPIRRADLRLAGPEHFLRERHG